ncbi:MAG: AbrB/MazE/SpoVT family DNA-binding domain-containing protein [Thiofilum sp.]|uniref:AbrB/MazE/SpoVT family DNA-binding domain-containing protein n=1 Tax=Thiofilum sp. TaxID=2212733 RepID=UPI0025F0328E|nr:AbrB/MazE/SpoVT family DNA-binding domain-containing protein [Thiofilum sp.]MBK8452553.1 AbrB/MazE/SpoVT family DNA-binding domain-containing protein [Thiofilum sp.]
MNACISTVTQKGQVTIPKSVRDNLNLMTGDKVEFVLTERGEVVLKPFTRKAAEVAGLLSKYKKPHPVSIEEMNEAVAQYIKDTAL